MAEVAREHWWHPPKSLDSDENFKPEHTLFCCKLRFVAIYAPFGKNSAFLGQKQCFFGKKCTIASYILHNLRICRENCKYALDENFRQN